MLLKKQYQKTYNYLVHYYISSHGFGHCSRAIPIIDFLLSKGFKVRAISGKRQIEFLKNFFKEENISYTIKTTDIGWIFKEDGLTLDRNNLINSLRDWLNSFPKLVEDEIEQIEQNAQPSIILSDISPLGFAVANRADIFSIGISNFTWIEQYRNANLPEDIVRKFEEYYNYCDLYLRCPFHTPQIIGKDYKDVGYIARDYDKSKAREIREEVLSSGVKTIVFLGIGASLSIKRKFQFGDDIFVFYGMGLSVYAKHKLYIGNRLNVQDYIAASDIAIIKPGWSTVAECVNAKVPMVIIKRDVYEDSCILQEIENNELGIGINMNELDILYSNDLSSIINRVNKNAFSQFKTFDYNYLLDVVYKRLLKGGSKV